MDESDVLRWVIQSRARVMKLRELNSFIRSFFGGVGTLSREYVVNGVPVHAPHPKHGTIEWCLYLDIFVDGCTLLRRLRTSRSTSYYNPTGSHSICVNHSGDRSVNICVVRGVDMVGERVKFNLHQPHNL